MEIKKKRNDHNGTHESTAEAFLDELRKNLVRSALCLHLPKSVSLNSGTLFYLHYYDLDDVLDDVLNDALADTSDVLDQSCVRQMNKLILVKKCNPTRSSATL